MITHQRVIADPHIAQYPIAANVHAIAQFDAGLGQNGASAYRNLLSESCEQMFEQRTPQVYSRQAGPLRGQLARAQTGIRATQHDRLHFKPGSDGQDGDLCTGTSNHLDPLDDRWLQESPRCL